MPRSAVLLALLFLACSSPGTTADAKKQVSDLCDRLEDRLCAGLESCGCNFGGRTYDASGCRSHRAADCRAQFATHVVPDLEAGRVQVHSPAVDACVAGIDALAGTCRSAGSGSDFLPPACALLFVDTAHVGEGCHVASGGLLFCAKGAGVCTGPSSDRRACTQLPDAGQACLKGLCAGSLACEDDVCRVAGAAGAACTSDAACGAGLACDTTGHCASPGNQGTSCERTSQCATGLRCDGGTCAEGTAAGEVCRAREVCGAAHACLSAPETRTCGTPAALGEACETGTCAKELQCDLSTSTCAANPSEGAACTGSLDCADGFGCSDADRKCHRLPGEGETCFMGDRFCAEGLGCDDGTQTCKKGGGDGAACLLNPPEYVCADGFGCDFASSTCKPLAGAGAKCETDRTCSADTFCRSGSCSPRQPAGSPCPDGNECLRSLTCAGFGANARCQPIPKRGEACIQTCEQGLVCKGAGGRCAPEFCVLP